MYDLTIDVNDNVKERLEKQSKKRSLDVASLIHIYINLDLREDRTPESLMEFIYNNKKNA